MRAPETLVVPKLDRLARSVPDARAMADQLEKCGVSLALGKQVPHRHSALPHHSGRDAIRCTGMQ
ncbi:MAG: recombinase family protein [Agrobacterium tumefaciens]